ncbi:MAG: YibE/F family protein [Bacillota bacterium]
MSERVILVVTVLILLTAGGQTARAQETEELFEPEVHRAVVLEVGELKANGASYFGEGSGTQKVRVRITAGELAGEELLLDHNLTGNPAYDLSVTQGDRVLVGITEDGDFSDTYIMDFIRDRSLAYMTLLFFAALVLVGGLRGAKIILVLGLTGLAVYYVLIPMVLAGRSPIGGAVLVGAGVTALTMIFLVGFSGKALSAGAGTVAGVVTAGLLAWFFGNQSNLMGLHSQEAQMLLFSTDVPIDFRGILFAGMILGALGAIMDVSVSIASTVEEVHAANPALTFWSLTRSGLNVGRDVLGTMANTLILAYTGGALPLLLLLVANRIESVKILNLDLIATEVIRALSGTIGLVVCIPLTALLAAAVKKGLPRASLRTEAETLTDD